MKDLIKNNKDLAELRNGKSELCISLVLPLAKLNPEREQNELVVQKAIERIRLQAAKVYPTKEISHLLKKVTSLYEQIDPLHPPEAIGIWVSDKLALLKSLPYPPEETIILNNRFAIREIIHLIALERPYSVLLLTQTSVAIFKGVMQQLTQVQAPSLKHEFEEHYEYALPSRSSSYAGNAHVKSFERDKELLAKERHNKHFKKIDFLLRKTGDPNSPLIVIGESRLNNAFCKISTHPASLLHTIEKDPSHLSASEISAMCWDVIQKTLAEEQLNKIEIFKESIGKGQARIGLQACWRAAQEGNCRSLLAERNFHHPGFLTKDPYHLFLKPPVEPHQIVADAVDQLMELVIEKNGEVLLVEPGLLHTENNIGLITRY